MKQILKQVFPVILIHLFIGFVVVFVFSMTGNIQPEILKPFEYTFKLWNALTEFTRFFPALMTAGLLTGFAMAFRKIIPEKVDRWSAKIFSSLTNAFLICIICIGVYILLSEGLVPVLKNKQEDIKAKTDAYNDYMFIAETEAAAGKYRSALSNAEAALSIWEESQEASVLAENMRLKLAETEIPGPETGNRASESGGGTPLPPQAGYSSFELLEKARESAQALDFYNAHYYAMLSWRLSRPDDPNRGAAMRLASEAWNRITASLDSVRAIPDQQWYRKKQRGYTAIQANDYLSAYYLFLEMDREQKAEAKGIDPDIERFLEISRRGLLESFFFTDETKSLRLFEQSGDVFFTLDKADGRKEAVLMKGISRGHIDRQDAAYLRGFELLRFDADGNLVFHIAVPYAKMFSFSPDGENPKPQLILTSVDREKENNRIDPEVISGEFPPPEAVSKSVIVLDMPYDDMNLLLSATAGPELMTLSELFSFSFKAESYGMEKDLYLAEFIQRISDPFIVFTVAILMLAWAWKLRLRKNRPFSAWWILVMPLVTVVCVYLMETARYAARLCILLFSVKIPAFSIPAILAVVAAGFFLTSLYFFAQRSD